MNSKKSKFTDIVTGIFFTSGLFGFMSGEFILSTVLFGAASVFSNVGLQRGAES